jgi:hypothetical protein
MNRVCTTNGRAAVQHPSSQRWTLTALAIPAGLPELRQIKGLGFTTGQSPMRQILGNRELFTTGTTMPGTPCHGRL